MSKAALIASYRRIATDGDVGFNRAESLKNKQYAKASLKTAAVTSLPTWVETLQQSFLTKVES